MRQHRFASEMNPGHTSPGSGMGSSGYGSAELSHRPGVLDTPNHGWGARCPAHSALWEALARPTSKGAGHSEEATTTRGLDGHP